MKNESVLKPVLRASSVLLATLLLACEAPSSSSPDQTTSGQSQVAPQALPYYGDHDVMLVEDGEGAWITDTVYFTVPFFAFTNQDNREISADDYSGHLYVTDFFFTTCPTICPMMSAQMSRLQDLLKQKALLGDVKLLSHTVDPTHDTPEVLKAYGERMNADFEHWNFVTGSEADLYDQAKYGYFLTALPSDTAAGGFFHSDTFVLIDREGHIRGYYDGTSTSEVDQLFNDIQILANNAHGMDNK